MKKSKFKIQNSKFKSVHGSRFTAHGSKGFTLVELMIAVTITVLALAAVYTTFIVQQRSFVVQEELSETEISSKIGFDMIVKRIRETGFVYPTRETPIINGISGTIATGDAGNGNSPDSITLVDGSSSIVGYIGLPAGKDSVQIEQRDATGYYVDICYTNTMRFNTTNMRYLSIDGIFYAEVTGINGNAAEADCGVLPKSRLYLDRPITIEFPVNRPIYLIGGVTFQLSDADNDGAIDDLQMGTETLASNIDDLQFAYAVDANDDGVIDDQNGNATVDPGDYFFTPTNPNPLPLGAKVLAVRVSLLARTSDPDPNLDPTTKPYAGGIRLENGSTIGAGDRIRRRVWTTEVLLRNPR